MEMKIEKNESVSIKETRKDVQLSKVYDPHRCTTFFEYEFNIFSENLRAIYKNVFI